MNKLSTSLILALAALGGSQVWAQTGRISSVSITTGVVAVTERTAANTNPPVTNANQPVYVGDNLAGLTFFNNNPGIDGLPASPTSSVLFTLTGSLIPGGALTDLHAFMGFGTLIGPPTLAATYNDVAPLLVANTTYAGLVFAAPNLGFPAPTIANEFYTIHHAVNGTDYLATIVPKTGGNSSVQDLKPMAWAGGPAGGPANTSLINGFYALAFAQPTPTGPYFANLFYYLRTDAAGHNQFGYVVPALVSGFLDTLDLNTAVGGFGNTGYTTLAFSDTAVGGYASNQFYYLRQDTTGTGYTILGRVDTTPGNRTISDIANLGGVFKTLTFALNATGTAPAWGNTQFYVAGAPLPLGAQSVSFAAIPDHNVLDAPFFVTPKASSGLDMDVTVVSGPATVVTVGVGALRTFSIVLTGAPGIVKLQARQAGSAAPFFVSNYLQQSFNVNGPLATAQVIPTKALTAGTAAVSFTPVTASGGTSPISFSVSPALPAGLSISATTGAITGTPTSASLATTYTVTATDALAATSSKTFSLTVNPALTANQAVLSTTLTAGTPAPSFTPVTPVGGTGPFTYVVSPLLPANLVFNASTGQVTGTPAAAAGLTTYTVTITDNVNATATNTFNLLVNAPAIPAPVVNPPFSAAGTVGAGFSYTITATNSPTSFGATGLPSGLTLSGATISGTPSSTGTTPVQLSATNGGGVGLATLNITIAAANSAPVINSPLTAAGATGVPFNYTITATNSPTNFSYGNALPSGLVLNPSTGAITGTPTSTGTTTVLIAASNAFGLGSGSVTITITGSGTAPIITNNPLTAGGTVGTPFGFTITASGSPASYAASPLPAGLTIVPATGVITGIPTTVGTTAVLLGATNGSGTGVATLTITVAAAGTAPVITNNPLTAAGTVGTPFSFAMSATGLPTSYVATGLPAGLTVNSLTGAISGTPTATGTSVVLLGATNSSGTGSATLTITVAASGAAPVITNSPTPLTAAGTLGTPFSFAITATGLPTSYSAFNLQPGLVINPLTGVISGTPTRATTTFVTLTATNASGSTNATLMIVTAPAAIGPVITSATSASGTAGAPFVTYLIAATGLPTSYTATGLPPGLTLDSVTGAINGTPTTPGTYLVTLTATNASGSSTTTLTITISPNPSSRIINFSARAISGPGSQTLIMGFVVAGDGKNLLVRGIGPGLAPYGVVNFLADPLLTLFDASGAVATNDDWQTSSTGQNQGALIAATAARVGAFALPSGSKDSALNFVVGSGAHTTGLLRPNSTTGVALTEIYDTDDNAATRLVNVSARMNVSTGEGALIAGFVIKGSVSKTVLIRGVGPTLSAFGVTGVLADPTIAVFTGNTQIASNDNWEVGSSTAAQLTATSARVGAFALTAGSKDAALLVTLQPGNYTVQVTGVGNTTGVALVEIYDTQ